MSARGEDGAAAGDDGLRVASRTPLTFEHARAAVGLPARQTSPHGTRSPQESLFPGRIVVSVGTVVRDSELS